MFPAIKKLVKCDDWTFAKDSAPSDRLNVVQDVLEKTLKCRLVKYLEWSSSSPELDPLDYFLGDLVKTKIYQDRAGELFSSEERLKTKMAVWKDCATDLKLLRKSIKQFVPRLRAVEEKQGYCIKMIFG